MDINKLEEEIKEIQNIIRFIQENKVMDEDTVETVIFKKYMELESTKKVTDYVNEKGYKKSTFNKQGVVQRKYITTDISSILKDKNVKVERELKSFVIKLFNKNKRGGFN